MAWAAAREWLGAERAFVTDLEIVSAHGVRGRRDARSAHPCPPVSAWVEIFSGRGLCARWQLHATAKIVRPSSEERNRAVQRAPKAANASPRLGHTNSRRDSGLHFGPAFPAGRQCQQIRRRVHHRRALPLASHGRLSIIDPHGSFLLSRTDRAVRRSDDATPYVPVRVADARLFKRANTIRAAIHRRVQRTHHPRDYRPILNNFVRPFARARFQAKSAGSALEYSALALVQRTHHAWRRFPDTRAPASRATRSPGNFTRFGRASADNARRGDARCCSRAGTRPSPSNWYANPAAKNRSSASTA